MDLLTFWRQPYPFSDSWVRSLGQSALIGAFVGTFLLVFQPFGIANWPTAHKALKVLGFGSITFGVLLVSSVGLPRLWPGVFTETRWTVGREVLVVLLELLLIGAANRVYLNAWLPQTQQYGWTSALSMTFLLGIFPVVAGVLTNYIVQLRRYSRQATTLTTHLDTYPGHPPAPLPDLPLTLRADNEKDRLTLPLNNLLAIESSDNYCTVYSWNGAQLTKHLLRSSLSRLGAQVQAQRPGVAPAFVRCHRSYVVNLERVERVSGNAQGYKLHLAAGTLLVPVARKYNDTLVKALKQT